MKIFVDTSAWYAYFDKADRKHREAVDFFHSKQEFVTSIIVIHETIALCHRRLTFLATDKLGNLIFNSNVTDILIPTLDQEKQSWDQFTKRGVLKISLVDISNKVIMENSGIDCIFAFDSHFEKLGLKVVP